MKETLDDMFRRTLRMSEEPTFGQYATGTALAYGTLVLTGAVLSVLWRWFIVPLGVPGIGMSHGVGIVTIVMLLVFLAMEKPRKHTRSEYNQYITRTIGLEFMSAIVSLGIGAIAHFCM